MPRALPLVALLAVAAACTNSGPCPIPLEVCGGLCIDLRTDAAHCGSCDHACGGGLVCNAGTCGSAAAAECAARTGGAWVTLEKCGETVKLWITNDVFVTRADALRQGEAVSGVPVLDLLAGSDCDGEWSWHADPTTASFQGPPVGGCDACPRALEDALGYYLDLAVWCPSGATVLAVDRR